MKAKQTVLLLAVMALVAFVLLPAMTQLSTIIYAQQGARGASPATAQAPAAGAAQGRGGGGRGGGGRGGGTPVIAGPPAGTQPLPIDLFSSKNFYKDEKL